ncbi:MAG: L-threonylcarbamoyladenylate synthase [Patescibacteria group bacterium]|nr:L-threonylcarbamoyladenylate synthase [bacterium]MDZ4240691.1 L-threonylcarbamoyladenylate synthase [Patescibacteria group bacterium]
MKKEELIKTLEKGGVGIMPTDTLYGLLGSALNPSVVERIYSLKGRDRKKPFIILISSFDDLEKFSIRINAKEREMLERFWPGKVTIIFSSGDKQYTYLDRGGGTLAFRMPALRSLLDIIARTGPLVAPSANVSGGEPAQTIEEAMAYFGNDPDFYIDGGRITSLPSTIVKMNKGGFMLVRPGVEEIPEELLTEGF